MGVTWAVLAEGGEAKAERVVRCTRSAIDLPPGPLTQVLESAPRGATILVDEQLVEGRPITAGLIRAWAERRGLELVMQVAPESLLAYAACLATWAYKPETPAIIARRLAAEKKSLAQIGRALERLGHPPPKGGTSWCRQSIKNLITKSP